MRGIIKTGTIVDRFVDENQRLLSAVATGEREKMVGRVTGESSQHAFYQALRRQKESGHVALIAEMKRAAPSAGSLNEDINVQKQAKIYQESGATAISVLTQPLDFHGSLKDLRDVCEAVSIPVLRKEFIIDPYQIYEAKEAGASAVLLIAMILEEGHLLELMNVCKRIGMDALVEVHDEADLKKVLDCHPSIIGVNARSLRDLSVDLSVVERLLPQIPNSIIQVAESGIIGREDVERVKKSGADAVLVGTILMQCGNSMGKMRELIGL